MDTILGRAIVAFYYCMMILTGIVLAGLDTIFPALFILVLNVISYSRVQMGSTRKYILNGTLIGVITFAIVKIL